MEVLKKAKSSFKFRVVKPFIKAGKTVGVGDEVRSRRMSDSVWFKAAA